MSGTKNDLAVLELFAAVAAKRSFRKAALELNIPVATLSRKISNLEERLQTQLLQRTTRSVVLTEPGQQLLDEIGEPLASLNRATRRATQRKDATSGLVKIATTYTLAETNILPVLGQLRIDWPQIRVQLMLDEGVVDIRSQRIDFAVRAGELQDLSLIARKLCTHRFIHYSTPKMQNMAAPGVISYSNDFGDAKSANVQIHDMRMVKELVLANQGQAWMPDALCLGEEKRGELIRTGENKSYSFDVFLVFGSKKFVPKRVRLVMDAIIEHAGSFARDVGEWTSINSDFIGG